MPDSKEIEAKSHKPVLQGYVLGAGEGEHLIHFRDGGNLHQGRPHNGVQ